MAYGVEQDRLRALLPEGFRSLRPVLRINAEIRNGCEGYLEYNTAVEKIAPDGENLRGWLNIACWEGVPFTRNGKTTVFENDALRISFTDVGIEGGCPAEKDNAGCFFLGAQARLRPPERIEANKVFCDCSFALRISPDAAHGVSLGKTLPAVPTEPRVVYPPLPLTVGHAAAIPCGQVLGAYAVRFVRQG